MDKYIHTFYLISGEVIVAYSEAKEIAHITFGRETAFVASDDNVTYTIPFFSVDRIETEDIQ